MTGRVEENGYVSVKVVEECWVESGNGGKVLSVAAEELERGAGAAVRGIEVRGNERMWEVRAGVIRKYWKGKGIYGDTVTQDAGRNCEKCWKSDIVFSTQPEEQERSSKPLEGQERKGPKALEEERKRKSRGEVGREFQSRLSRKRRWKRLEKVREGNESAERSCKILEKVMMCWKALRGSGKAARASGGAAVAGKRMKSA
ncbi:hypothetical protein E2C01_049851 [Portunus trituberculatus]|uniref:Uncharacterized protein n=1 Tax=Portunus trituberculatus TaxID=210409 RepID=A0A5B7GE78_PORTR|nr:hypothetical protein [Portunus trituberculatus]